MTILQHRTMRSIEVIIGYILITSLRFVAGIGADIGLTDPVFCKRLIEKGLDKDKLEDMPKIGEMWIE
jgi:hypothetical protein